MLYVTTRYEVKEGPPVYAEVNWHVGGPSLTTKVSVPSVVEVQADGDELFEIQNTMLNLPMPIKPEVVRWYGDHAKFIVANLK